MDQGFTAIGVALITAISGIIVALIQVMRRDVRSAAKENRDDHAVVQAQLRMIYRQVVRVDDKIEKHLDTHREGASDGEVEG
jgi:hypothetical protein